MSCNNNSKDLLVTIKNLKDNVQSLSVDKQHLVKSIEIARETWHEQVWKLRKGEQKIQGLREEIAWLGSWKSKNLNTNDKYQSTINELVGHIQYLLKLDNDYIQGCRLAERDSYKNQIRSIKNELKTKDNETSAVVTEIDILTQKDCDLKMKLDMLEENYKCLSEKKRTQERELMELQESHSYVVAECNAYKEHISSLFRELQHTKKMLIEVKNNHAEILVKIHSAHEPLVQSKGNSTFSDIEDECLQLLRTNFHLKNKYEELLRRTKRQCQDLSILMTKEAAALHFTYARFVEPDKDNTDMIKTMEVQIDNLTIANKFWKSESDMPINIISPIERNILENVKEVVIFNKRSIYELQQELSNRSFSLYVSQNRGTSYKQESVKAKHQIATLRSELLDRTVKWLCQEEEAISKLQVRILAQHETWQSKSSSQETFVKDPSSEAPVSHKVYEMCQEVDIQNEDVSVEINVSQLTVLYRKLKRDSKK